MANVLITSIIRNEARFLDRWADQIRQIIASQPEHRFGLSVFENDSEDGSAQKLASYDWGTLPRTITAGWLNSPFFTGGNSPTRTALLADARNRAIRQFPMLPVMDWVLVVEPDTGYTMETADRLINHERYYGRKLDIFTGKSSPPGSNGLYDSWASRKTAEQSDWVQGDDEFAGFTDMWTTFNCMAIYRADAIRAGHTFSGINPRTGKPDCDTSAICDAFRLAGYNQIAWDTNVRVEHFG